MSEFDQMLEAVNEGDECVVTRDGKEVAVILPIGEYEAMVQAIDEHTGGDDAS